MSTMDFSESNKIRVTNPGPDVFEEIADAMAKRTERMVIIVGGNIILNAGTPIGYSLILENSDAITFDGGDIQGLTMIDCKNVVIRQPIDCESFVARGCSFQYEGDDFPLNSTNWYLDNCSFGTYFPRITLVKNGSLKDIDQPRRIIITSNQIYNEGKKSGDRKITQQLIHSGSKTTLYIDVKDYFQFYTIEGGNNNIYEFRCPKFFSLTEQCTKNTYYFDVAPKYFQTPRGQRPVGGVIPRATYRYGKLDDRATSFVEGCFTMDQTLVETELPLN